MDKQLEEVERKASILIDALPYIRDFNQKVVVVEYGCGEWLSGREEQKLMQDIALLSTIGMKPIVVHSTRMGVDKFRENKRVAKLIELCGVKAIGICGVDAETLTMSMNHGYIPVIVPNDIDNENVYLDPRETAHEIAVKMHADKLVYLTQYPGIFMDETRTAVYPRITIPDLQKMMKVRNFPEEFVILLDKAMHAVNEGVNRAHILDGRIEHVLLTEFFSVAGAGTIIISDNSTLYPHERELR